ncbi:amidohydrolase [Halococcus morrhuae DSM 1307]|uniref:Amidohydrolase n=1 Tax=Halococcus morrhuae DSM 1307 TaxID=931277 RepID=M0M8I9_HALMO|nr:hypothetical protein [Halococcus morrhuae]EMA40725.1 amidohydrolase [Halococcus morrhuae DSM 1307]
MTVDLVIANGTLVTPDRLLDSAIAVDDGEIVAVGDERTLPDADERVDASGMLVLPGVVDPHVHIDGRSCVD